MNKSIVTTPSEAVVQVTRNFEASVQSVWKAFTDTDMVRKWMLGPPGWIMPVCDLDFKVGGEYRNVFRNEEQGLEIQISGVFREIHEHHRIVQDEAHMIGSSSAGVGSGTVVTITFAESDSGTTATTTIAYETENARDQALATGMGPAMESGYQRIDALLLADQGS
jgi:uncharacterized protein YndB with AHSA1/START domain